jgi:hypothetical protein
MRDYSHDHSSDASALSMCLANQVLTYSKDSFDLYFDLSFEPRVHGKQQNLFNELSCM